jgi:hypothetical protein
MTVSDQPRRTPPSQANAALWCVAMIVVALVPLFASFGAGPVVLVAVVAAVVGAALSSLRRVASAARYLPVVFGVVLIVGAVVASTSHRSLALSWVGGLVFGLLASDVVTPRRVERRGAVR